MPTDAAPTMPFDLRNNVVLAAAFLIIGLTGLRLLSLWLGETQLSTDEAQYWLWGQNFSLGAYSKPPMIGWIIAASTAVFGDSTWAVRMPAPLFHMVAALSILALGLRLATPWVAALAATIYLTLPAVTLGSFLMTTDTPMLAAIALALWVQHILAGRKSGAPSNAALVVALGAILAFGLMCKYAMLYAIGGMILAAVFSSAWRIRWQDTATVTIVTMLLILPNLVWVAGNNFVTVQHMADTSGFTGPMLHPLVALRFVGEQFGVFGPIIFLAWLVALAQVKALSKPFQGLLAASGMILAGVIVQALLGKALANWAVGFAVGASIIAAMKLAKHPVLIGLSFAIGGGLALALPVLTVLGSELRQNDRLVLGRYLGQDKLVAEAVSMARKTGAMHVASNHRDILSALSWQGRNSGLTVEALPYDGAPRNYWEMSRSLSASRDDLVLIVTVAAPELSCPAEAGPLDAQRKPAGPGFLEGHEVYMTTVPAACIQGVKE